MSVNRRRFLASTTAAVLGGAAGPSWMGVRALQAGALPRRRGAPDRILVVVQLTGGNDGLNTVIPYRDPAYAALRPKLRVAERDVIRLDDELGLHPSLRGLDRLLQQEHLAIVSGVGYPNPDRSHFTSMRIWHTARLDADPRTEGWLSRGLTTTRGKMPALHIADTQLPQSLAGGARHVPSFDRREQALLARPLDAEMLDVTSEAGASGNPLLAATRESLVTAYDTHRRMTESENSGSEQDYPLFRPLGRRLRLIASLIRAELETNVYYTELDGFDTHSNQNTTHPGLLAHVGDSLAAFHDDLADSGHADQVCTLVFSEFGRRAAENGSAGTDHGTSGPVFVLGSSVNAGLYGAAPDLDTLVDGDPRFGIDFRRVYTALLERWLDVDAEAILGESFEPLPVI